MEWREKVSTIAPGTFVIAILGLAKGVPFVNLFFSIFE